MKVEHMEIISEEARQAQRRVFERTGLSVEYDVMLITPIPSTVDVKDLLQSIADALNMEYEDYCNKSRTQMYVELRQIAMLFLKQYFPEMTVTTMGSIFDLDHTTVISGLRRGRELLSTNDVRFWEKYNNAVAAIDRMKRKKRVQEKQQNNGL